MGNIGYLVVHDQNGSKVIRTMDQITVQLVCKLITLLQNKAL